MCGSSGRICLITSRALCGEPLARRVDRVLQCGIGLVILREKDLPAEQLLPIAREIQGLCADHGAELLVNSHVEIAREIGAAGVQLPWAAFMEMETAPPPRDLQVGVSVHSLAEALRAQSWGADRVLYGNIYETGCKPGLQGRGLSLLREMAQALEIPVWAVGGISPENIGEVLRAGAQTACVMSALLQTEDVAETVRDYRRGAAADVDRR